MIKQEDVEGRLHDMSRDELQRAFIDIWVGNQSWLEWEADPILEKIAEALGYDVLAK